MLTRPHFAHVALSSLICMGCDYVVLTTEVGEHVVYHWDASEKRLYGGTVAIADGLVEAVPAYYELPFVRAGPKVEYFWGTELTDSGLCLSADACTRWFGRPAVFTPAHTLYADDPIHTHELGHTSSGGYGAPGFFNEGFAARWQSGLIDGGLPYSIQPTVLSETELREQYHAQFQLGGLEVDRERGFAWWVALEAQYGPAKVGEFITALGGSASLSDVDVALQRVFGISLEDSAALAAKLPTGTSVTDPACVMQTLPTMVWSGDSLVVERDDAHYGDRDIGNWGDKGDAIWLFALEFPEPGVLVEMRVTVPPGMTEPAHKFLYLGTCTASILSLSSSSPIVRYLPAPQGEADEASGAMEDPNEDGLPPGVAARWVATGRWVGGLVARPDADGSIVFPVVEFRAEQP